MRARAVVAAFLVLLFLPATSLIGGPPLPGYAGGYDHNGYSDGTAYESETLLLSYGTPQPPNLLPDSWQFTEAVWSGVSAAASVFPSQVDLWGGNTASIVKNNGVGPPSAAWYQESLAAGIPVPAGEVTLSAYYKRVASAGTITGELRLYNLTRSSLCSANYSITTGGVLTIVGATTGVTGAAEALPDAWYRVSASFDISALGLGWVVGDSVRPQLMLWNGSTDATLFIMLAGVQLNEGATASTYQEKP